MCHFYLLLINLKPVIFCRYFALNTEMRHRALQTGRIYIRQNPHDGHLTVDELRDMVRVSEVFSDKSPTLRCQSSWNSTVLDETEESSHCYGGHTRSTHCILHTQCC